MTTYSRFRAVSALAFTVMTAAGTSACTATVRPRAGVTYVRVAPPPRVVEVRGPAPGRGFIWIAGHHEYRGNSYVWVPGRYTSPAAGYNRWVEGSWKRDRNGWYWVEGHWR